MAPLLKSVKKAAAAELNGQEKSGTKTKLNRNFKNLSGIQKKKHSSNSKVLKKMIKGQENLINSTVQSPYKDIKKLLKSSPIKLQNNVRNNHGTSIKKKKKQALQNENKKPSNGVSQSPTKMTQNTPSFDNRQQRDQKTPVQDTKLPESSPSQSKSRSHKMSRKKRRKLQRQQLAGNKTSPNNSFSVVQNGGKNLKKAVRKNPFMSSDFEVINSKDEHEREQTLQISKREDRLDETDSEDELSMEIEDEEGIDLSVDDSAVSEDEDRISRSSSISDDGGDEISKESNSSGFDANLDEDEIFGVSDTSDDDSDADIKKRMITGNKRNKNGNINIENKVKSRDGKGENGSEQSNDDEVHVNTKRKIKKNCPLLVKVNKGSVNASNMKLNEISPAEELVGNVDTSSDSDEEKHSNGDNLTEEMEGEFSTEESEDDDDQLNVNECDESNIKINIYETRKLMVKQNNKMNGELGNRTVMKKNISPEDELGANVDVSNDFDGNINDLEEEEDTENSAVESDDDALDINDKSDEKINVNQIKKLLEKQRNNMNKDPVSMAVTKNHKIGPEEELEGNMVVEDGEILEKDDDKDFSVKTNGIKVLKKKKNVGEPLTRVKESSKNMLGSDGQENKGSELKKKKSKLKDEKQQKSMQKVTKFIVFITKLPSTATEEDVKNHFKDVPSIKQVNLVKDRKTGKFLRRGTMELSDFASYAKALSLSKSDMDGWTINVIPDRSMPRGASRGLIQMNVKDKIPREYKLCVSQLPVSLGWKKIKKHFSAVSSIKQFIFPPVSEDKKGAESQRTMILEFGDQESYEKILALNGSLLDEQPINVEPLVPVGKTKKRKTDESDTPKKKQKVETPPESAQPAEKEPYTVHVGFIPPLVTSEKLEKHFRQAGKILECVVHEARSNSKHKTGFLVMADEEGYQNALALKGSALDGKKIDVQKFLKQAKKKKKRFVVFVGNIPFTLKEDDVRKHFKDIGNILDVRFPLNKENKSQGFAYVEVADQASYEKCLSLNHSFLNGRRINVQYSVSRGKSGDRKPHSNSFKQKLFKLQTLSKNENFQSQNLNRRKRSKPDQKKRAYFRSKRNEEP